MSVLLCYCHLCLLMRFVLVNCWDRLWYHLMSSLMRTLKSGFFFFFFFQAEDGIRDIGVPGVQTCALPISVARWGSQRSHAQSASRPGVVSTARSTSPGACSAASWPSTAARAPTDGPRGPEIGRASCRERV